MACLALTAPSPAQRDAGERARQPEFADDEVVGIARVEVEERVQDGARAQAAGADGNAEQHGGGDRRGEDHESGRQRERPGTACLISGPELEDSSTVSGVTSIGLPSDCFRYIVNVSQQFEKGTRHA
jgi:hypothetical protein